MGLPAHCHERSAHYEHFIHCCNHHRAHGGLGWSTPTATLSDNVHGHQFEAITC